jgi:ATPase family associated with various cellular activities (AAA)
MASAQQLIGLVKSHAEGNGERFFDLAMQLAASEEQKGHKTLAEQLRQWAEAGKKPENLEVRRGPIPIVAPRGELSDLIRASYPSNKLSDLILPDRLQTELAAIVNESRLAARLEESGLKPRRHLLFAGPPGTGKTLTASAIAGELKYPLFTVLLHGLISKFMGETAQKLRLIFDAIVNQRGVYLFDEIDALAGARTSTNDVGEARRVLNSFLQFLDEKGGGSIVVATTNLPQILDHAILRRFDVVLKYVLPDEISIKATFVRRLIGFDAHTVDWKMVIRKALGLSTSDIVIAAEDAARSAVLSGHREITTNDLLLAIESRHSLQQIGAGFGAKKSQSPVGSRNRKKSPLPSKEGARKGPKRRS